MENGMKITQNAKTRNSVTVNTRTIALFAYKLLGLTTQLIHQQQLLLWTALLFQSFPAQGYPNPLTYNQCWVEYFATPVYFYMLLALICQIFNCHTALLRQFWEWAPGSTLFFFPD